MTGLTGIRPHLLAIAGMAVAWFATATEGTAIAEEQRIEGTATYRERIALDPRAELLVKLEDVSLQDVPAVPIASMRFATGGRVPVAFSLPYQSDVIQPSHTYSVRAELVLDRKVIFRTTRHYPVLTRDAGDNVDLLLVRATAGKPLPSSPAGAWLAEAIDGGSMIDKVQLTLTIEIDGAVHGQAGCNTFSGAAEVDGRKIVFGQMATTLKACLPAVNEQERKFMRALGETRAYRIEGNQLFLLDGDSGELMRLIHHAG